MREIRLCDINPFCILKDLLFNLWVILICSLIAMMGTEVVLENLFQPIYTSSATYYVSPKDSTYSAYYNLSIAYEMAVAICEVFESDIMAVKAAESMELPALPGTVLADVPENTNLLHLQAKSSSPELAFRIVTAIMENHKQVSDYVFDNVVIDILDRPTVPAYPSNKISTAQAKKQAAIIGGLLAIMLIAAFSVLRDTVKTAEALKYYLDARLLATIRHEMKNKTVKSKIKHINRSLLITNPVVGYSFSESIKRLCTKLEHTSNLRKHVVFLVTSACENEGKSTISANLALGLARCGYKVMLMDCDLRKPEQYKMIDKNPEPMTDFSKYLRGKASIDEVIMQDKKTGLYLLVNKSSCHNSADLLASLQMERMLNYCKNKMDYIIIDSPPMSVISDTEILVGYSDASLLVVRQDYTFVKLLNDTIDKLQASSDFLGCIYNNVWEINLSVTNNYERIYGKYYKKIG